MTQRKDGWLSMEEIRSPVTVNPDFWPWAWVTLIVFAVTPHTQKHAHNQTMTFLKVSELSWRSDSGLDGNWKRRQTKKRLSVQFFPVLFKEKKTAQKSWPCHNSNIVLGFTGLLRSPKPIKCVWDSQLIRQAPGFSLQKALSQFVSVTVILIKKRTKATGVSGMRWFSALWGFFS